MNAATMFEDEEPPTRPASWNVPRAVAPRPSWIAPSAASEPRTPPPPKLPVIEVIPISEESHHEPELHEKRDAEEIARLHAEVDHLREELARAAASIARVREELAREAEPGVIELAVAIAERVVGKELTTSPSIVVDWAREGLATLGGDRVASLSVSPDVARALSEDDRSLVGVEIAIDESLPAGSCVVCSANARVDESASSRMRAVTSALEKS